jgi:S1-C subfamily serine protease
MIQSNLNYSPGMSGSPLLNTEGQVIGINTMLVSDSLIGGQVDLAIPSNILSRCIHDYHKYGESKMSFLGIEVKMMTELYARKQNFKDRYGVLLSFVHRGHSAHKAGLRRNDRIISINDRLVYNRTSLRGFLNEYTIGTQIKIKVQRRNRVFDVHLKIGDLDSFKPPRRFRESRYFFLM